MITLTYRPTVTLTVLKNCYHEISRLINKTVKLHFLSSVVLEIGNVNAKSSNFYRWVIAM